MVLHKSIITRSGANVANNMNIVYDTFFVSLSVTWSTFAQQYNYVIIITSSQYRKYCAILVVSVATDLLPRKIRKDFWDTLYIDCSYILNEHLLLLSYIFAIWRFHCGQANGTDVRKLCEVNAFLESEEAKVILFIGSLIVWMLDSAERRNQLLLRQTQQLPISILRRTFSDSYLSALRKKRGWFVILSVIAPDHFHISSTVDVNKD
jgi:hypothetical protein